MDWNHVRSHYSYTIFYNTSLVERVDPASMRYLRLIRRVTFRSNYFRLLQIATFAYRVQQCVSPVSQENYKEKNHYTKLFYDVSCFALSLCPSECRLNVWKQFFLSSERLFPLWILRIALYHTKWAMQSTDFNIPFVVRFWCCRPSTFDANIPFYEWSEFFALFARTMGGLHKLWPRNGK